MKLGLNLLGEGLQTIKNLADSLDLLQHNLAELATGRLQGLVLQKQLDIDHDVVEGVYNLLGGSSAQTLKGEELLRPKQLFLQELAAGDVTGDDGDKLLAHSAPQAQGELHRKLDAVFSEAAHLDNLADHRGSARLGHPPEPFLMSLPFIFGH